MVCGVWWEASSKCGGVRGWRYFNEALFAVVWMGKRPWGRLPGIGKPPKLKPTLCIFCPVPAAWNRQAVLVAIEDRTPTRQWTFSPQPAKKKKRTFRGGNNKCTQLRFLFGTIPQIQSFPNSIFSKHIAWLHRLFLFNIVWVSNVLTANIHVCFEYESRKTVQKFVTKTTLGQDGNCCHKQPALLSWQSA